MVENTLEELHKSFAFLSQEEQKYANLFLHDVQTGDIQLEDTKTLRDYITMYMNQAGKEQIQRLHRYLGCDEKKVTELLQAGVVKENLNAYGRFDALKATVDKKKAKQYFECIDGKQIPPFRVGNRINAFLTDFILSGGKEVVEIPREELKNSKTK